VSISRPCGGVVAERSETGFFAGDHVGDVLMLTRLDRLAGSTRDLLNTGVELREFTGELRPICLGAARRFPVHGLGAGGAELAHLRVHALPVRRYPCIAVNHGSILHRISATEKPNPFKALILRKSGFSATRRRTAARTCR
jgi:hypothetical protein